MIERIVESIAPETWDRAGGNGTLRLFRATHSLVIRNVPDVHDEIAELLARLRSARDKEAKDSAEAATGQPSDTKTTERP